MRKTISGLLAGLVLVLMPLSVSATEFSTPSGYIQDQQRLLMAREPDGEVGIDRADSEYVGYYDDGRSASLDDIVWAEGREGHGKAVTLDGRGDCLSIGYNQLRLTNFSVSMWVNWQGGEDGQKLLSIVQDDRNYIALSPHYRDEETAQDDGRIANGLFLEVSIAGERETAYRASQPEVSTGLPRDQWHHIAIVAKQPSISLYVDGVLWTQVLWNISLRELNANYMHIGGGLGDDPSLKALVDDVEVYSFDLSEDQLLMLAGGVDPLEEGATVPTTTTLPPVTTTTTAAPPLTVLDQNGGKDQSLRLALTVGGVGLGLFVLLTAGSLIFGKKTPADPPADEGGTAR